MKTKALLSILVCAVMLAGCSSEKKENAYTEITRLGVENGKWNLDFDIVSYKMPDFGQTLLVKGMFEGDTLGFQIVLESNPAEAFDTMDTIADYLVSFRTTGSESDKLFLALNKIFGAKFKKTTFRPLIQCPAYLVSGYANDLRKGFVSLHLKGGESVIGRYFEMLLNFDKDKQTVWIKEVDIEFRKPFLMAISN